MHSAIARIALGGPVRFDRFQADALYAADGFYTTGGAAGRGGDFLTAVEASIGFAVCIVGELDAQWQRAGEPDPYVVVEGGAGIGTLCADVFELSPLCRDALRWVMVETSQAQRDVAMARLADETFPGTEHLPVAAMSDLGRLRLENGAHVVVSNELLDNLPVRVVRRGHRWEELFVALAKTRASDLKLEERWEPMGANSTTRAERHGAGVADGVEFPLADHAVQWIVRALGLLGPTGLLLAFDYGASTAELAGRGRSGWMRTYSRHSRGRGPLDDVGNQDITSDVAFDQLPGAPTLERQADWLNDRGLEQFRSGSGRLRWPNDAGLRDQKQRYRDSEIDTLIDPGGMGAFTVATWSKRGLGTAVQPGPKGS